MGRPVPQEPAAVAPVSYTSDLGCPGDTKVAGWKVNYSNRPFAMNTVDQAERGSVQLIQVTSSKIHTDSGIHIGSTRSEVVSAYGASARVTKSAISDLYVIDGEQGKLVVEVARQASFGSPKSPYWPAADVNRVQLMMVWGADSTPISLLATDGIGGCA